MEVVYEMSEEHPKIVFMGKTYYQVGCKRCGKGEDWNIYSDGKEFIAKCKCGHTLLIKEVVTARKPDFIEARDLRMVI